ncbi:MAG: hypothetical protein PHZ26_03615 [Candidatus Gracilibacteria bacterium]|nr:hypothetical protein [Candidatus Gracilibacteria bacterium]MDD2908815.1 hypothetical protein [Candidatus Gracilibacteria bacterium]
MKVKVSLILTSLLVLSFAQAFAAEVTDLGEETATTTSESADTTVTPADTTSLGEESIPSDVGTTTDSGTEEGLNAASGKDVVMSPKGSIGNYSEVACDKDFFLSNACNQCFEGGKKMVGEKIAGLTDSWTNPNATEQIIYSDEQKMPELINLGGANTTWVNNPLEAEKFWKYNDEIVWTDSATGPNKQEFLLEGGKTVNFLEADLGASYALQSSDKKEGDAVGLLKFYVNYHDTDATAKETEALMHTECVAYYAGTPTAAPIVPVTPPEAIKVKTGPESFVLIIMALILSLGLLKFRKKV